MINAGGPPTMTLYITSDLATTYNVEIYNGPVLRAGSVATGEIVTATIPMRQIPPLFYRRSCRK